jgi:SNW domain-containing protein 1
MEVDSRLHNQSASMDSGFGEDDEYNAYSKPLFNRKGVSSSSIYRPTRWETEYNTDEQYDKFVKGATSKFQSDKRFAGAEDYGGHPNSGAARTAPVQFEKEQK